MLATTMLRNPHSQAPLNTVLDKLQRAAALSFEQAHPIPAEVNHSEAFHEFEQQRVFQQEWICVGRVDEMPAPGDFLTHEIAAVPVLVVRQDDRSLRAFVNAWFPKPGVRRNALPAAITPGPTIAPAHCCARHTWK